MWCLLPSLPPKILFNLGKEKSSQFSNWLHTNNILADSDDLVFSKENAIRKPHSTDDDLKKKSTLITYTVTFQSDEVNFHGDELFWISTEILNMFHKVSTEFVATFKYTENHNVIVSNVLHDIFGQTFYPKAKIKDKCMLKAWGFSNTNIFYVVQRDSIKLHT